MYFDTHLEKLHLIDTEIENERLTLWSSNFTICFTVFTWISLVYVLTLIDVVTSELAADPQFRYLFQFVFAIPPQLSPVGLTHPILL